MIPSDIIDPPYLSVMRQLEEKTFATKLLMDELDRTQKLMDRLSGLSGYTNVLGRLFPR